MSMWRWLLLRWMALCLLMVIATVTATVAVGQALPGDQLAFVSDRDGNQEIYLLDVWRGISHNLTRSPAHDNMPAWSGDGQWLAYRSGLDFYMMDNTGRHGRQLTRTRMGLTVQQIALSPDGSQLAYVRQESTTDRPPQQRLSVPTGTFFDDEIFIMDTILLTEAVNITTNFTDDRFPVWRADGTLLFATERNRAWAFVQLDMQTPDAASDLVIAVTLPVAAATPMLSPDGTRIVYVYNRELFVRDIASGDTRRLTERIGIDNQPAWSADGRWIVFASWRGRQSNLILIAADGTGLRQITTAPGMNALPTWRPS